MHYYQGKRVVALYVLCPINIQKININIPFSIDLSILMRVTRHQ